MLQPETNSSLVVFVNAEEEAAVKLTYASASLKTLAVSVCAWLRSCLRSLGLYYCSSLAQECCELMCAGS